jgi:hypothetical protein
LYKEHPRRRKNGAGIVAKPILRRLFMKKQYLFIIVVLVGGLLFGGCDIIADLLGLNSGEEEDSPPPQDDGPSFYVSAEGKDDNSGETAESPLPTLQKAYEAAVRDSVRKRIVVLSDLESESLVSLSPANIVGARDETVTIAGKRSGIKIERSKGTDNSVLEITGGANVKFENITINGKTSDTVYHRAISISGKKTQVTLGNEVVISGAGINGSGILVYNTVADTTKLILDAGSVITACEPVSDDQYRSAVMVQGKFAHLTINDGASISYNNVDNGSDYGGGFYLRDGGKAVMNGGIIHGNKASTGGGVYIDDTGLGEFTMNGGTISGNQAAIGGGIYLAAGKFTMNGGVIYGNEAGIDDGLKNTATNEGAAFYKNKGTATLLTSALNTSEETIGTPSH